MKLDPHHRKLRSQGGDDSWGNQIKIPREYHDLIHAQPEIAHEYGLYVYEHEDPQTIEPDLVGFLQAVGQESEPEKPVKRPRLKGDEKRKRRTVSIRVPDDEEDGGGIWDDTQDRIKQRLIRYGLYTEGDNIPAYEAWIAAAQDWLDTEVSEPTQREEGMA